MDWPALLAVEGGNLAAAAGAAAGAAPLVAVESLEAVSAPSAAELPPAAAAAISPAAVHAQEHPATAAEPYSRGLLHQEACLVKPAVQGSYALLGSSLGFQHCPGRMLNHHQQKMEAFSQQPWHSGTDTAGLGRLTAEGSLPAGCLPWLAVFVPGRLSFAASHAGSADRLEGDRQSVVGAGQAQLEALARD